MKTNKKTTKRALLLSVVSMFMCIAMLMGTTYAWFTDSVTSKNNVIKSGNLDVELYYQVEGQTDWTEVDANTNVFKENALWEPGHTEVVKLKVVNAGTLALRYQLGVNVADEVGSVNVLGDEFKLSDYIKYGIVDGEQDYDRDAAIAAVDATAKALNVAYSSGAKALEPEKDSIVTMVVYMPTTVGNEANYAKNAAVPTINLGINLFATQVEAEYDSFGNDYDENALVVGSAEEAQAALDSLKPNTTIQLMAGVNYGTLYLRPSPDNPSTVDNVDYIFDWTGNNYGYESLTVFDGLTIVGAEGATVDAIEIEGGTYYQTAHSQQDKYPVMQSLIELKNVVIDGVTFTGNGGYDPQGHGNVINLSGGNIKVDGLTLKNCVLNNVDNNARLIYKTESTTTVHNYTCNGEALTFVPSLKNITVTDCILNGGYIGLELRETENVTITNNTFNIADRNILLPVNSGCTYTGTVTITGNVSNRANERFVRADGTGSAKVVITDNAIIDYMGADEDYIKVTNADQACLTIENNTITRAQKASTPDELAKALKAGGSVILGSDIVMTDSVNISNADFVLDGNGYTISMGDTYTNPYALFDITGGKATIKNVTFDGIKEGAVVRTVGVEFNADNVTAINGVHTQVQGLFRLMGKNTITNCTFKNNTCNMVVTLNYDGANNDPQVVENCVFENNTCNATAVLYYVKGDGCTLDGNTFIGNKVNCTGNGATVYMGFTEGNTIINNVFKDNVVTESGTSKRVAGALMLGYAAVVKNNAFINNTVNGERAVANDVCASAYYTDIDLSGNYWGGEAPVENDNYFNEYPNNYSVIINDYLTAYEN